jgi:hypothetical protein
MVAQAPAGPRIVTLAGNLPCANSEDGMTHHVALALPASPCVATWLGIEAVAQQEERSALNSA